VTASGSGFVYDKQGHIVTNGHVGGNARIVDVTFVDGSRYTAKVIARDPYSDIVINPLNCLFTHASESYK
jgi:S1-C subfamily serine protease